MYRRFETDVAFCEARASHIARNPAYRDVWHAKLVKYINSHASVRGKLLKETWLNPREEIAKSKTQSHSKPSLNLVTSSPKYLMECG